MDCLVAIFDEAIFTETYTWNSKHNTSKTKKKLPMVLQNAIMHVARAASKGNPKVNDRDLEFGFRSKFSSYAKKQKKKRKAAEVRDTDMW